MKNIWIMTWFTLREALARKVFIFFLTISAVVLVIMAVVLGLSDKASFTMNVSGGNMQFTNPINMIEMMIVSPLSGLCLLLAIFASASFVPIMLEKGNIDLLLSKPVSRDQLLWGKYFGGILVVLINIAFLVIGVWMIISIKFSYWDFSFLTIILVITFTFAVLYSIIVLLGVTSKGSTLGMMVAYFIYIILSPLLYLGKDKLLVFIQSDFIKSLIKGAYYVVPKTQELMGQITKDLASGKGIEDYQPILTSLAFLILTMGISISIFRKKDF
ncbi:MAG: ABC transporter permease [Bacteroidetes bacterium]|nr:ABC transporter permease [Bacteroidota bacterium]